MTDRLTRGAILRRGALAGGALAMGGVGATVLAAPAGAMTFPDVDLAYLRLLTAAELLALDYQGQALSGGQLSGDAGKIVAQAAADDKAHYAGARRPATARATSPRDRRRHRLRLSERQLRLAGLGPQAREHDREPRPRRLRRRAREPPDAADPPAGHPDRRERSTARRRPLPARRQARDRQGLRACALDRRRDLRPRRLRELTDGEAGLQPQGGGRSARDQRRHAAPLGQGRSHPRRPRREQPARRLGGRDRPPARRRRRAPTSAPATASTRS